VKFLLARILSGSRNVILRHPTTCRVMYGLTVILQLTVGGIFSGIQALICTRIMQMFQNESKCNAECLRTQLFILSWNELGFFLLGASSGKDPCQIKVSYCTQQSIVSRTATN